jgi:hypothetical protein
MPMTLGNERQASGHGSGALPLFLDKAFMAVFAAGRKREMQIPTRWTDKSIFIIISISNKTGTPVEKQM